MPFCPACGNQVAEAEGIRFCPRCGRDLTSPALPGQAPAPTQAGGALPPPPPPPPPTDAPPSVHAAPTAHVPTALPPPGQPVYGPAQPGYGPGYPPPGPVAPGPGAVFVRRVFTGRWEAPLLVALGPALTILVAGLAIAGAAGAALPGGTIGMATRTRAALAVLVQGLGGNLKQTTTVTTDEDFTDPSDDGDNGDEFSDGGSDGSDGGDEFPDGGSDGSDGGFDFSDGGSDGSDGGFDFSDGGSDGSDGGDFSDGGSDGSDGGDFSDGGSDGSDGGDLSDGGTDGSDGIDFSDGGSDIGYTASGSGAHSLTYHWTLSVLPWTVTLVWVLALVLGLRVMRRRQQSAVAAAAAAGATDDGTAFGAGALGAGAKAESAAAAVRVALLAAAAALALGFAAEPKIGPAHFTTAPFLAALWTFVLSLVTALLVLCRPSLLEWLAARPGAAAAYRVLATTATALLATLLIAGATVFVIALAHYDDLTGWGVAAAGLLLLNLGVSGLGLGWGAPFRVGVSASGSEDSSHHVSFGLGDLNHVWGGWSVTGVVAGALCCALLIGVLAVRRCRTRPEQFAVAGLFTVLLVILAAVSGGHTGGDERLPGVLSHLSVGTEVPELLGLSLLWTFGGVLVAPYVWRLFGGQVPPPAGVAPYATGPGAPSPYGTGTRGGATYGGTYGAAVPPQPGPPAGAYGPAQPPGPPAPAEPTVHDLGVVEPDRLRKQPPEHR
ncbi:hypothetical protein SAMN05216223_107325 [Actinacidiphila yanglinensis]|uniref:Zinc-ribbon domain-containing protein n=1 Tax=Actinacidiphila yanglinensis TaxID=310779 RepID=A0A1H6BX38_9ACTN|nr:zinc ribbon domain-containing protein [Actinacidiphila yanglinensis]SEG65264.1 hypothetical protein SAMN05216223_107325 [Actinacidiphila yanglinensis]